MARFRADLMEIAAAPAGNAGGAASDVHV